MNRGHALAAAAITTCGTWCASPSRAAAEPPRRADVGVFAGFDRFGSNSELGNSWASDQVPGSAPLVGLRAGVILLPDLAGGSDLDPALGLEIEGKYAFASTGDMPASGRASYGAPVLGWRMQLVARLGLAGRLAPHLVVGGGGESVLTSSPYMTDDTDAAFHWGPGASLKLGAGLDLRLDLRHGLTAARGGGVTSTFEAQLGIARVFEWGGTPRPRAVEPAPRDVGDDDGDPADPASMNDGAVIPPDLNAGKGAVLEPDRDNDGVADGGDGCPDQPEDRDDFEDTDGCPDLDNDRDTRNDPDDTCPDLPETYNGFEDENGCPDTVPAALAAFTGAVEAIKFDAGKARLKTSSRKALDAAATALREHAAVRIRIEGHTVAGDRDPNVALSLKRADAVKWYLVEKGVAADRIETAGVGPDRPRDEGTSRKARARNERVEIHLVFTDPTAPVQ